MLCCVLLLAAASAQGAVTPNGLVVLLTDYGADSVYVGAIKGAIYTKFPQARIDAISNAVPPFDIAAGAFMLAEAAREFPPGTTFCCVVDPGVGTERKCVALETNSGHLFVAPDNGLLSLVAQRLGVAAVRECSNRALWREGKLSHTFQGRDIFGPVSAALASGVPLEQVGAALERLTPLDLGEVVTKDGNVSGTVVRVDPYGNLITNIGFEDLERLGFKKDDVIDVTIGKAAFQIPLKQTYSDVAKGARVGLIQSYGYLEFAVNLGSLAGEIKEEAHAAVSIRKAP